MIIKRQKTTKKLIILPNFQKSINNAFVDIFQFKIKLKKVNQLYHARPKLID